MSVLPIVATQRLGRHVTVATNISNNKQIVAAVIVCKARVILKESLRIPLPLLGSVHNFSR
jgi:hypothetical protein